jgi:hypothetical protein
MRGDQLVRDFLWAVYEKGEQYSGWVGAGQIMPSLGLDPKNLTTEDDRLYIRVAESCEVLGYIEKAADMYRLVRITESGKQYVKSGFRRL